jgi:hypothetical protein
VKSNKLLRTTGGGAYWGHMEAFGMQGFKCGTLQ